MWKALLISVLKSLGLAALETGTAVAKEKLTPKGIPKNPTKPT